jgi:hypothetical protein
MTASVPAKSSERRAGPATTRFFYVLAAATGLFYAVLLTRGRFNPFGSELYGLVFNSMLSHMLHGRWDVDPAAVAREAFVRNGLTYAYFGPFPAVLRLPLLLLPGWQGLHVERVSCWLAMLLGIAAQSSAILAALARVRASVRQAIAPILLVACAFSGPPMLLVWKGAAVYTEAILWAWALSVCFVALALRAGLRGMPLTTSVLAAMATCAGLCLLTRSTTGGGLTIALGLFMLRNILAGPRQGLFRRLAHREFWVPSLILLGFMMVAGAVNQGRWGTPFSFADLHGQIYLIAQYPDRMPRLDQYGLFNLQRFWIGCLYYFAPVWTASAENSFHLGPVIARLFDALELPASSFLLTDPLWCVLSVGGIFAILRGRAFAGSYALVPGLCVAPCLMLVAWYMSFRYRAEFAPALLFLSCVGLAAWAPRLDDAMADRASQLVRWLCVLQIVGACATGFAYLMAPFGPSPGYSGISLFAAPSPLRSQIHQAPEVAPAHSPPSRPSTSPPAG